MKIYKCSNNAVAAIKADGECYIQGFGGSMEPILHSGDVFKFKRIDDDTELNKKDIVFCKVHGNLMLHKIVAIQGARYQIGNNKGRINGWTQRKNLYGLFQDVVKTKG